MSSMEEPADDSPHSDHGELSEESSLESIWFKLGFRVVGNKTFPFLDLPPELRLQVYEIMYSKDAPIDASDISNLGNSPEGFCRGDTNLLETCRQVYQEASCALYRNAFLIEDPELHDYKFGSFAHRIRDIVYNFKPVYEQTTMSEEWVLYYDACSIPSRVETFKSLERMTVILDPKDGPEPNVELFFITTKGLLLSLLEIVPLSVEVRVKGRGDDAFNQKCQDIFERLMPFQGTLLGESE